MAEAGFGGGRTQTVLASAPLTLGVTDGFAILCPMLGFTMWILVFILYAEMLHKESTLRKSTPVDEVSSLSINE